MAPTLDNILEAWPFGGKKKTASGDGILLSYTSNPDEKMFSVDHIHAWLNTYNKKMLDFHHKVNGKYGDEKGITMTDDTTAQQVVDILKEDARYYSGLRSKKHKKTNSNANSNRKFKKSSLVRSKYVREGGHYRGKRSAGFKRWNNKNKHGVRQSKTCKCGKK